VIRAIKCRLLARLKNPAKILQVTEQFCADIGDGVHATSSSDKHSSRTVVAEQHDEGMAPTTSASQLRGGAGNSAPPRPPSVKDESSAASSPDV